MAEPPLDFYFQSLRVGYFETPEFPTGGGRYPYAPYRGTGHYLMQMTLERAGSARCSYQVGERRIFFTVVGCPAHGVLELAHFEEER